MWLYVGPPPSAAALALAVPAALLALACNLAAQHAFAGAAFWLRDARSTWFLYQKLVFLLGGMLLPLEFLPRALADVAKVLPFAAMAYAPARLASGHVEPRLLARAGGLAGRAPRLRRRRCSRPASGGWRWWADDGRARDGAHRASWRRGRTGAASGSRWRS